MKLEDLDKYPRLRRVLKSQCNLTDSEAIACVWAYRSDDLEGGGEAVWHYGGVAKCITDAWKRRENERTTRHTRARITITRCRGRGEAITRLRTLGFTFKEAKRFYKAHESSLGVNA